MTPLPFYIVDVFAEEKYAGNQLAVFRNARELSTETMQRITRETNFSEATFILSDAERDGGYDVRIFTPATEVPFAGHPTLGTAFVIRQEIIRNDVEQVKLNLQLKQIPVTFVPEADADVLWMKQKAPEFGPVVDPAEIAGMLGLEEKDLDNTFPAQEVSTGMWFVIAPLVNLEAVKRAKIVRDKSTAFFESRQSKGILLFSPETYQSQNDLNARVFVPYYGVEEDPATGSGNGCLAGYLIQHRYFGGDRIDVRVEQGYEIDRPSLIRLKAEQQEEAIDVNVGGRVVMVARGDWV